MSSKSTQVHTLEKDVEDVKTLINYLVKKIEEIDKKVDKIIKFLNEFCTVSDCLTYLTSIILSERAKKALEELKKI